MVNILGRQWDVGRILPNHEDRLVELEKRALRGATILGSNAPRWRSRPPVDANINNTVLTNLGYSTTDTAPDHDLGSSAFVSFVTPAGEPRYLFAVAGLYFVRASLQWNGAANGTRKLHLFRNADTVPMASTEMPNAGAAAGVHIDVEDTLAFNAGDYLRVAAWQNSGGAVQFIAAGIAGQFADSTLTIAPMGAYAVT
jgi:hypothetical protein